MTRDEMARALAELPFRLLRRLARTTAGPQVLRMGKRRLIHMIMAEAETSPERVEAALRTFHAEQQAVEALPAVGSEGRADPKAAKPADLAAFLDGIGVPAPHPFVPDD